MSTKLALASWCGWRAWKTLGGHKSMVLITGKSVWTWSLVRSGVEKEKYIFL